MEIDNTKPGYKIDKPLQTAEIASIAAVTGYGTIWFDSVTKEFRVTLSDGTILPLSPRYAALSVTGGSASGVGASSQWHAYKGFTEGPGSGLDFVAGILRTDISAFASWDSGNKTKVTTTGAHGLSDGDVISITATVSYNGLHVISEVGTNDFVIETDFVANDGSGTLCRPDALQIDTAGDGDYQIAWTGSVSVETAADLCHLGIFVNDSPVNLTIHQFASIDDLVSLSGSAVVAVEAGDIIWLGYKNTAAANDITIGEMAFSVRRM